MHSYNMDISIVQCSIKAVCEAVWTLTKPPKQPLPSPQEACFPRKVQQCQQNPVTAGEVVPTDDARWRGKFQYSLL